MIRKYSQIFHELNNQSVDQFMDIRYILYVIQVAKYTKTYGSFKKGGDSNNNNLHLFVKELKEVSFT